MCDHGDDKGNEYIDLDDIANCRVLGYEVYVCECGALVNLQDSRNFKEKCYAMSYEEINTMLRDMIDLSLDEAKHKLIDFLESKL